MTGRIRLFLLAAPLFAAAVPAAAADGARLYEQRLCHTCHGREGRDPALPMYPKLAGQSSVYAFQQMRDIRDGRRSNGLSAAMRATVSGVPDAELRAIAEWLEAQ
jgi:cytochrome c553